MPYSGISTPTGSEASDREPEPSPKLPQDGRCVFTPTYDSRYKVRCCDCKLKTYYTYIYDPSFEKQLRPYEIRCKKCHHSICDNCTWKTYALYWVCWACSKTVLFCCNDDDLVKAAKYGLIYPDTCTRCGYFRDRACWEWVWKVDEHEGYNGYY
ncbi:hypothetical protein EX30DRAFT_340891 [Ascodesmis nigricans]|uniref:Uncharacterized protein n=1 Tax=Ascodesmis nigricans TaxID=341454 RepID=A0A4S2MX61_9PEZI|nr:hypothetical protein EX30DRAFT_340891 [Ascodesmis nigricans]